MKIINEEVGLRDETRNLKQAQGGLKPEEWKTATGELWATQKGITTRTDAVLEKIRELPDADSFRKEMMQLENAGRAMTDAEALLEEQKANGETIAAETEAIEWLLLAKRSGGGGGGGNNAGNGARNGGRFSGSALAQLGGSQEGNAKQIQRSTRQATGKAGKELPEEFRYGLDRYSKRWKRRPTSRKIIKYIENQNLEASKDETQTNFLPAVVYVNQPAAGQEAVEIEMEAGEIIVGMAGEGPAISGKAKEKFWQAKTIQLQHLFANEIRMMNWRAISTPGKN